MNKTDTKAVDKSSTNKADIKKANKFQIYIN